SRDGGRRLPGKAVLEVRGLGPIDADHDDRALRRAIGAAVDGDGRSVHGATDTTVSLPLTKVGFRPGSVHAARPVPGGRGGAASGDAPTPIRGPRVAPSARRRTSTGPSRRPSRARDSAGPRTPRRRRRGGEGASSFARPGAGSYRSWRWPRAGSTRA